MWWIVPALRGATETAGASSDTCTSQKRGVPGTTSSTLAGQVGTEKDPFDPLEVGGMIWE
jgi:hypothetical protein